LGSQFWLFHKKPLSTKSKHFQGLMTGLIYNRPTDPIQFLESASAKLRQNPALELKWFV
jgi:hypothetical protein